MDTRKSEGPLVLRAAKDNPNPVNPQGIKDHALRHALTNEMHARPFPTLTVPMQVAFLAIKHPVDAANRDPDYDRLHLLELLDHHGASHPQAGATHYQGELGRYRLKWERHTEFVTYTLFGDIPTGPAFEPDAFAALPDAWLQKAPGDRLSSVLIRVEKHPEDQEQINRKLAQWFIPESLAASYVADQSALVAGDFRIDAGGHMRFAIFARNGTTPRRIGRIVQRVCEIEVYKTMSLLALPRARSLSKHLARLDGEVLSLVQHVKGTQRPAKDVLAELLELSSDLENFRAQHSFRFSATAAYRAIVNDRVSALREIRIAGRQTFSEFMTRRYEPAMRTISAAANQLDHMAERTKRAGDLLRTRVEVARSEQNQDLLVSMDRRADLQLRLQKTVEGLSVVAISYYAVNLAANLLGPFTAGLGKTTLLAILTPLVVIGVWLVVRRIRKSVP